MVLLDAPCKPSIDYSTSHGAVKHRIGSVSVHDALAHSFPLLEWENPTTGRRARVCQVGTVFGIQIIELHAGQWVEVTAFVKSKLTRLEQVQKYLRNTGYQPFEA